MKKRDGAALVSAALLNDRLKGDDDAMAAADAVVEYLSKELMPIARKLVELAKSGDREAAVYVLDRLMGRPKQHMDARVASIVWTPEDYRRLALQMMEDAKRLGSGLDSGCTMELQEPVPVGEDDLSERSPGEPEADTAGRDY